MSNQSSPLICQARTEAYKEDIRFGDLASIDEKFNTLYGRGEAAERLDFQNPEHARQLTCAILRAHYGVDIQIPEDRLCPPVPVRFNYVHWIKELLGSTAPLDYPNHADREIVGLDIGVGATNIYSLLVLSSNPKWRMHGTDIDPMNLLSARANTARNPILSSRMSSLTLVDKTDTTIIPPLEKLDEQHIDFVMCNPPFFASVEEMKASLRGDGKKGRPPALCTGAEVEMVTEGGDAGFVGKLVDESVTLREEVQWYSAMLGKLSSVEQVVMRLKDRGCTNWAVGSLREWGRTRRWAVAWSWGARRPSSVARGDGINKALLPFPAEYYITYHYSPAPPDGAKAAKTAYVTACSKIDITLRALDLEWKVLEDVHNATPEPGPGLVPFRGVGKVRENVWSRAARRKKKRSKVDETEAGEGSGDGAHREAKTGRVGLTFSIETSKEGFVLHWLEGVDQVLFESMCGFINRLVIGTNEAEA